MTSFKRILCPTDFSQPSYEAVKAANELALHFSAELFIVNVVQPIPTPGFPASPSPAVFNLPEYEKEMEISAHRSLEKVVEEQISSDVQVHPIVVRGMAANQIVQVAEEKKADLIVIATHGRTGWRRFIFGSVAERVIRLATCAVLTVQVLKEEA